MSALVTIPPAVTARIHAALCDPRVRVLAAREGWSVPDPAGARTGRLLEPVVVADVENGDGARMTVVVGR